nr:MAG TPA: hypothetical protein [Microviridae sp.]
MHSEYNKTITNIEKEERKHYNRDTKGDRSTPQNVHDLKKLKKAPEKLEN